MTEEFQYKAFLSYSHKDKKAGAWLHKQLEKYRLPKNLMSTLSEDGRSSGSGGGTRGIGRIFRDRDELPAAEDLTEAVRKALETSQYMVVLCSPNSAASRWVNKEIIEFKRLRGDKYVLPIIIDGEPFASDSGAPEQECFPPAVRFKIAKTGGLSTLPAEPAAADARRDADGKQRAVLKILAGILGVGLDQLVEREMRRRQKRVTIITAGAAAAVLVMATLTYEAMTARDAANRSRAEAEDLVEFMLTDLREKLEPVGRLDVLDAVGEKVLSYHDNQLAYEDASDDDIGRRARAYHLLAEMEWKRGNMDEAQTMFEQAAAATGELLKRDPNNTKRIFEHAQSVFWVGNMDFERGNFRDAEIAFSNYKEMADRLVELESGNVDWLIEQAYGNHNLGDLLLHGMNKPNNAIPYIQDAARLFAEAYKVRSGSLFLKRYVVIEYATLTEAYQSVGHVSEAKKFNELEGAALRDLLDQEKNSVTAMARVAYWKSKQGSIYLATDHTAEAIESWQEALAHLKRILSVEPQNSMWQEDKALIELYLTNALISNGQLREAGSLYRDAYNSNIILSNGKVDNRHKLDIKFLSSLTALKLNSVSHLYTSPPVLSELFRDLVDSIDQLSRNQRGRFVTASIFEFKIQELLKANKYEEADNLFDKLIDRIDGENLEQTPALLAVMLRISDSLNSKSYSALIRQALIDRGYGQAIVGAVIPVPEIYEGRE